MQLSKVASNAQRCGLRFLLSAVARLTLLRVSEPVVCLLLRQACSLPWPVHAARVDTVRLGYDALAS